MIDFDKYSAYALFRLPFADEIRVVCQHDENHADADRMFVMIPFDSSKHKTIKIHPDVEMSIKTELLSTEMRSSCISLNNEEVTYKQSFERFISAIPSRFPKLVLSRSITTDYTGKPIDTFIRACNTYPRTMVYLCHTKENGTWIGSTPEILIAGSKSHYRTVALAGTMTSEGEWSEKNKKEQAIVADYIRNIITPMSSVVEEEGPYTSRAGKLFHLKTEFHFSPLPHIKVSDFVEKLNPTPAVCGLPKEEAKTFIIENEGYDRSYYSGVVGMLDIQGETNLYVNLRCCNVKDDKVTLYAGGGIIPGSTVKSEYLETEEKIKTIQYVL